MSRSGKTDPQLAKTLVRRLATVLESMALLKTKALLWIVPLTACATAIEVEPSGATGSGAGGSAQAGSRAVAPDGSGSNTTTPSTGPSESDAATANDAGRDAKGGSENDSAPTGTGGAQNDPGPIGGGGSTSGSECTATSAVKFQGALTVPSNLCLQIDFTQEQRNWVNKVSINPTAVGPYPVGYSWSNCTASGNSSFAAPWATETLAVNPSCPLFVQLEGDGADIGFQAWWPT